MQAPSPKANPEDVLKRKFLRIISKFMAPIGIAAPHPKNNPNINISIINTLIYLIYYGERRHDLSPSTFHKQDLYGFKLSIVTKQKA